MIYQALYDESSDLCPAIKNVHGKCRSEKNIHGINIPARFVPYTHDLIVQDLNHLDSAVVEIAGGGSKYKYVYIWRTNNGYHYCFYDDLTMKSASVRTGTYTVKHKAWCNTGSYLFEM